MTINEISSDSPQTDAVLPADTAAPPLAAGCRSPASRISSFVSSGRGGLPTNPIDPLSNGVLWQDFSSLDTLSEAAISDVSASGISNLLDEESSGGAPSAYMVEASGWMRDRNGTPVLIAQSESSMERSSETSIC